MMNVGRGLLWMGMVALLWAPGCAEPVVPDPVVIEKTITLQLRFKDSCGSGFVCSYDASCMGAVQLIAKRVSDKSVIGSSCTPLNLCCASELGDIRDREACVAALLKAGADPNKCSPFGPMYHAQRFGRERILAMLIEAGGSVNTGNGLSLLVPVISQGLTRTYPYFLQAGAVIPTSDELRRISWGDDHNELQDPYLQKVLAAGSFANYAKAHRARLLAILAPKFPHLPKEMVSVVIDFWAHVGFY